MTFQVPILFCFPTPRREQSARKAMAATAASHALQIATAALDPSVTYPACGPAWMALHGGHGPMRLIGLDDVLPDPWRVARAEDERGNGNAASWPPCSPTLSPRTRRTTRCGRTSDDPPGSRLPRRFRRSLVWRFRRRPKQVGENAGPGTADSAGQRRNIPAAQATRLTG